MEQAYDAIKRRIITLELGPGERVDDYQLSIELELGRTPVREAIFLLAAEGLIDMKAGMIVRPLDLLDIAHLFEAHIVVAKATARLVAVRSTPQALAEIEKAAGRVERAIAQRDYLAITSENAKLHRAEAVAAQNDHLRTMADKIHDQGQRLAYLCFGGGGGWDGLDEHFEKVKRDHLALLDAYRRRDPDDAEQIATDHVRLFRDRVKVFLDSPAVDALQFSEGDLAPVALGELR